MFFFSFFFFNCPILFLTVLALSLYLAPSLSLSFRTSPPVCVSSNPLVRSSRCRPSRQTGQCPHPLFSLLHKMNSKWIHSQCQIVPEKRVKKNIISRNASS